MGRKIIFHEHGKDPMYKTWHSSEEAMFIYMHSDGGSIVCREKMYPIKNGVLCFVGAGKYHYTMPDAPDKYDRSKIFIGEKDFGDILRILPEINGKFSSGSFVYAQIQENDIEVVEDIFRKIQNHGNDSAYGKMIMISGIIELLVFLDKYSLESTSAVSGIMNRAIEYINSNIREDLTIDAICKLLHISKYHFCREFKKTTGTTVMKYILKTRIIMAKSMLLNDNVSITEVSSKCGFSSVSYFSRIFKEETGISPLKFKRQ